VEKLISPKKAAQLLSVTTDCLRKWEVSGKLKCVKTLGGHRRYKLEDIKKVILFYSKDNYYLKEGYFNLESLFRPTKFHEKVSRLGGENNYC
jgi:excisionase family DNA binding protein